MQNRSRCGFVEADVYKRQVYNNEVFIIEVNPRSSRTVPYISKVTGVPMVELAVRCMPVSYTHLDVYKRQGAGQRRCGELQPQRAAGL